MTLRQLVVDLEIRKKLSMVEAAFEAQDVIVQNLVSKYMHILGIKVRPKVVFKSKLHSWWLGMCHASGLIELLLAIREDLTTLEKVLAHEMVHWRNFSVPGKADFDDPHPNDPRKRGHGAGFMEGAAIVNAIMGPNFVTVTSDQHVLSKNMQHYYLVVWPLHNDKGYAWLWTATMTEKGKQMLTFIRALAKIDAPPKVFKTTDERWLRGKKLGGNSKSLTYSVGFSGTDVKDALEGIYNETSLPVGTFRIRNM